MGNKPGGILQPLEECNVECQEEKRKEKLYLAMKKHKKQVAQSTKDYENAKHKYYHHAYGRNWKKDKLLKEDNRKLQTSFNKKLLHYQTQFKALTKHFVDTAYLAQHQKLLISKNKTITKENKDRIDTFKQNLEDLQTDISTTNRKIQFMKNEIKLFSSKTKIQKRLLIVLCVLIFCLLGFFIYNERMRKTKTIL
tara:strand:+ start:2300 stop:2884 length:585 start_codon:yes stop_codon:yes gene_type:complete